MSTLSAVPWTRAVLAAGAASRVLVLSACGAHDTGDDVASAKGSRTPTAGASAKSKDAQKARLQFAACMRRNGVDMPDPGADGTKLTMPSDPAKFSSAVEKCKQYMPSADGQGSVDSASANAQALKLARCLRGKGIDVPDPSADKPLNIPDAESQKTQDAMKACGGGVSGRAGQ
jgi:hypothetical protein